MAHGSLPLLRVLLSMLDDERNDIFLQDVYKRQQHVDVIVPGNHSVVTGGSDGGAGTTVISEVILVADVDECLQYIEYCVVPFLLDVLNIQTFFCFTAAKVWILRTSRRNGTPQYSIY